MNFRQHKERLLKNSKVRKEYERLGPEFHLAQSLIKARLKKGWTQAELARRVGTQQPNIARLEGGIMIGFPCLPLKRWLGRLERKSRSSSPPKELASRFQVIVADLRN